jgi:hypothetical protein
VVVPAGLLGRQAFPPVNVRIPSSHKSEALEEIGIKLEQTQYVNLNKNLILRPLHSRQHAHYRSHEIVSAKEY